MATKKTAATAVTATATATTAYTVVTPVNHDGEDYAPGDEVALSAAQAQALLAVGAVVEPSTPVEQSDGGEGNN